MYRNVIILYIKVDRPTVPDNYGCIIAEEMVCVLTYVHVVLMFACTESTLTELTTLYAGDFLSLECLLPYTLVLNTCAYWDTSENVCASM